MKTKVIVIIFTLSICSNIYAQLNNSIVINNVVARQTGNMLAVEMVINGEKAGLSSAEKVVLTPVVKSGERILELPSVTISGNKRYKADKRVLYFFNKEKNLPDTYRKKESSNIHYTDEVAFEPWMANAVLVIKQEIYGCAACKENEGFNSVINSIETISKPEVKFTVSYIDPPTEVEKKRNDRGAAHLEFHAGESVIIPGFKNNSQELNEIEEVLNQITNAPSITITSINLRGYASPEGSSALNARLSLERANALKEYLQKKYSYNTDLFNVSSGGEDWEDLEKLVKESDLADKDRLLEIITSSSAEDAKERNLEAYTNSFRILLNNYYPILRRVDYQVDYVVRAFSAEEGREIIKTNPKQLSLNEMYLIANAYGKGSSAFKEVFDVAVRLYPDNIIANLNAAAIELEDEDALSAHRYLDKYIQVPEAWNNVGILYALEGDLSKAKEFLLKAKENGSVEAGENLSKLQLLEDYEKLMVPLP